MKNKLCPLIGKKCKKHKCSWYVQVKATDTQTHRPINPFFCVIVWIATLGVKEIVEIHKEVEAIESFRDEILKKQYQIEYIKPDPIPHPRDYSIRSPEWKDPPRLVPPQLEVPKRGDE